MAVSKGLAGVGHCEEDLQGCISHGSRSTRDMFIRNVRRGGGSLGSLVCGILVRLNVGYVRSAVVHRLHLFAHAQPRGADNVLDDIKTRSTECVAVVDMLHMFAFAQHGEVPPRRPRPRPRPRLIQLRPLRLLQIRLRLQLVRG